MEQDQTIAEEGEILDEDSVNNYIPLERPTNYSTTSSTDRFNVQQQQQQLQQESDSEDELVSASDSDSDSDCMVYKVKKPKIKLKKPKVKKIQNLKRKKYDIWSNRVQEEVLAETLNSCDVTYKDRSRDVESYDYTIGQKIYGGAESRTSNKRSRSDRNNPNLRLRRRSSSNEKTDTNSAPRHILDLTVTCENTPEEIARDIANKLYEEKEDLLKKIVDHAGKTKALEIFKETQRIEAEGGLMIMNQTRRRTPGGVFLFLLRHDSDLTRDQLRLIFDEDKQKDKEIMKMKRKIKLNKMKKKNALSNSNKDLPDLLTRAELCVQKLAKDNNRTRKESSNVDVINPPPTPETDGHDNSCDGMEQNNDDDHIHSGRKLENYEVDFLDLGNTNTMDLF